MTAARSADIKQEATVVILDQESPFTIEQSPIKVLEHK
jgi:hypothetical protein